MLLPMSHELSSTSCMNSPTLKSSWSILHVKLELDIKKRKPESKVRSPFYVPRKKPQDVQQPRDTCVLMLSLRNRKESLNYNHEIFSYFVLHCIHLYTAIKRYIYV